MNKTTAKHTPGPWSHCCDSGYSSKCLRGVQHSKKAAVHCDVGERPTIASHVTNWADARLIAAAPDLLDAAEAGEYLGDKLGAGIDLPPALIAEKLRVIRAALRKARGEAGA